jgi:uncharacterized protein
MDPVVQFAEVQRIQNELVLSPTDLTKHLGCPHITTLDLLCLDGTLRLAPLTMP